MKIDIEKVFWMIKQSEWMDEDERHTEGFRSGVKNIRTWIYGWKFQYLCGTFNLFSLLHFLYWELY